MTHPEEKTQATIFVLVAACDGVQSYNTRSWGWYPTKAQAEADIFADNNDLIFESGTFTYAVIVEVPPGFMGGLDERNHWWYLAVQREEIGEYRIERLPEAPTAWERIDGLGLG